MQNTYMYKILFIDPYMLYLILYMILFIDPYLLYFIFSILQSVQENDQNSPVNNQTSKTFRRTMLDEKIMNKLNSLKL